MNKTKIDWCDSTFNPVTGCLHGCTYCYAKGIANRFKGYLKSGSYSGGKGIFDLESPCYKLNKSLNYEKAPYPFGFKPTFHRYRLDDYKNKKGRTIFVCSMADLFGEWVPDEWIRDVFAACEAAPQHRYLFLTKNPKRYIELYNNKVLPYKENFWFGTSCTTPSDEFVWFKDTPYKSFVSIEPILAPFGRFSTSNFVNWVIVGAETGIRKNKITPEKEWIDRIVRECKTSKTPVFMKESLKNIMGDDFIQEYPWEVEKDA